MSKKNKTTSFKFKSTIFFVLSCSFCTIILGQKSQFHTDAKEYGFRGKVKVVSQYNFWPDSVLKKDSTYYLPNKNSFHFKQTYFFNKSGDIDSTITMFSYIDVNTKKRKLVYYNLIYSLDSAGIKCCFKTYADDGKLKEEGDIKWIDSTHYVRTKYEFRLDGKRSKTEEINFALTSKFREASYDVKTFGIVNGKLLSNYVVTNIFDKDDFLKRKRVEYKGQSSEWDEAKYIDQKLDSMSNPTETLRITSASSWLEMFILTEYSYY